MCDAADTQKPGWKGWMDLPPVAMGAGQGPWIDLSHVLSEDLPRVTFFPMPRFSRIMSQPERPMNVTEIQMVVHVGTHVDAPIHFISDGPASRFDSVIPAPHSRAARSSEKARR